MLVSPLARVGWMLGWSMAAVVVIGDPAVAKNGWSFDTWDNGSGKACAMLHEADGHILVVMHARISGNPDAGVVSFTFTDDKLTEAAKANAPAQLEFDTATVEGYQLEYTSSGFVSITMATYALSDLFAKFEKAVHLDVVSSSSRTSFTLDGFEDALAQLRACAEPR